LHGTANPLAVDDRAGTKPLGYAAFQYQYDYRSAYGSSPSNCRVASGNLSFRFETILPQLALRDGASNRLKDRWLPFQELIIEHEAGHHAIYRQLVTELPQALTDIGEVPCTELDDRVRVAVTATVDTIRQASIDYDDSYGAEEYLASSF
jgi:predicted secreted Zn-dependent protease